MVQIDFVIDRYSAFAHQAPLIRLCPQSSSLYERILGIATNSLCLAAISKPGARKQQEYPDITPSGYESPISTKPRHQSDTVSMKHMTAIGVMPQVTNPSECIFTQQDALSTHVCSDICDYFFQHWR